MLRVGEGFKSYGWLNRVLVAGGVYSMKQTDLEIIFASCLL